MDGPIVNKLQIHIKLYRLYCQRFPTEVLFMVEKCVSKFKVGMREWNELGPFEFIEECDYTIVYVWR